MKRNVAIVAGGDTSEHDVSLKSAEGLYSFMDKEKYNIFVVEMEGPKWSVHLDNGKQVPVDLNTFGFQYEGTETRFDFAYITIHGTPGEDGRLQGYFDMMRIPYSCCGVLPAALTYNKFACNQYLKGFGIKVADSILLKKGQTISNEDVVSKIGLPCFIKPSLGGSSFGVSKVKTPGEIQPAIVKAFDEAQEVVIESFLNGTELTCGCYKTHTKTVTFPVTEVVSHDEFFDYDAKYKGKVDEITPARISDELSQRVQLVTSSIYDILGCEGIIRIDYIITEGHIINLLEINTTPGMTTTSFIPQQIRAAKLDIKNVLTEIIENKFKA
jgi:D-alanine-D-alanine ligase